MTELELIIHRKTVTAGRLFFVFPVAGESFESFERRFEQAEEARGRVEYTVDEWWHLLEVVGGKLLRPVVFVDIDGVLNSYDWWERRGLRPSPATPTSDARWIFDPAAVLRLNRLVKDTGAVVVISSKWRSGPLDEIAAMLRACGFTGEVIGKTPDFSAAPGTVPRIQFVMRGDRGAEIKAWLEEYGPRPHVILDDDNEGLQDLPLVQTDFETGLLDEHVDAAMATLAKRVA